jgi:hypothetical protein
LKWRRDVLDGNCTETFEGPDLGDDGNRSQLGDASKCLQGLDHCAHLCGRRLDQAVDGLVETGEALAHVQHLGDAVGEGDLLGFLLELQRLDPAQLRAKTFWILVRATATSAKLRRKVPMC